MKIKLLLLFIIFRGLCNAQVGIGTPLPNNSSQLDVVAANRGILITRVQLQSTTSMSPIINAGSLPSSLLVFNEATAGTSPLNVTPGYYYWFNNKWNRVVISSETTIPEGSVIYNPVTNTFSYIDQNGNQQTINFQDIVKDSETITTLVNAVDGKHTYTNENNTVTVIDVVSDVTNNASTIFNNPAVVTELTNIIKNDETLTSLVYDATGNTLTYTPENGVPTVVNLLNLVQGAETQTSLIYDSTAQTLTYNPENGIPTIINLSNLVKGSETITTLSNATDGKHTYTNENNTVTVIDVVGDVTNNASTIFNNPAVVTELTNIIKNDETLTSLVYDATGNTLTYTPENGVPTVVNLLNLVQGAETQTSLIYDSTAQTLTYNPENGIPTIINLSNLVKGSETITAVTPVVTTGNTIANYSNEVGTSVAIQETITTQSQNLTTGDISYTNEAGTISASKIVSANSGNLITVGTDGGSFIDNAAIVANQTVTTITPIITAGNVIAQYVNEAGGTPVDIRETTTKITPVVLSGNIIANYYNEEGLQENIQETLTSLSYDSATSTLSYSNENGTATPLDLSGLKSSITAGDNVTITGNGETATPYTINSPIETALLTPSTAIIASATTVAVPSTNVQGAVEDLATELKQKWDIRGNSATVAGINFLGTTDNVDLVFKRNNIQSGLLSTNNTSFGVGANQDSGGNSNVAIGTSSLNLNNRGNYNTVLGYNALAKSVSGSFNVAIGTNSLSNSTVNNNTAIGYSALIENTIGTRNVAIGVLTLSSNTTGSNNISIADFSLGANTTGSNNIASGLNALESNTTGNYNIATGVEAMIANQTGSLNVAIGYRALANNSVGNNNTGIGNSAGNSGSTGSNNTALGDSALYSNFSGGNNTVMGANALYGNANGSGNVAIGFESGRYFGASGTNNLNTVNNSVYVGNQIRALNNFATNEVVIGYAALGRGNNTVQIGNDVMTSIGGQVAWSNPSDLRLKKDIKTSSFGINFINKLRPVTYHLKKGTTDLQSGFIAQEVESAANSIGYEFSGIVKPATDKDFYSLRYSEFVVPLVKAVQEQQLVIEKQSQKITDLETRLQRLEEVVNKLK
ncbi:tail fiber domain-containing protein [Flavobacterium tistrianum]|uniref:tail fiber domain-containing protein n=1 Tax=Flavobacterium tistrianum TaxID=1685414 RepID=UPI000DAEF44F|nr:tail fiber domain-containing protein [Flavobacterium tistrianum]KAF2338084.1 hypothetical protein DMB71_18825 [Flavobacterium tistrianum]